MEKPIIPRSNMALVGFYYIKETAQLMNALEFITNNRAGTGEEFSLTDALIKMIKDGVKFKSQKVEGWYDVGKKDILLETNAIMLKKREGKTVNKGECHNCIVIPPVSIAAGVKLNNSIIGPNVSIGENTVINYSILKNSIIGSFTKLENVVLHSSLIGSDSSITGLSQSLNIGDNTEIDLRGEAK